MKDTTIFKEAYAQYDAQLIEVSKAKSRVSTADRAVDTARQEAVFAQRNLDHQQAVSRRLIKAAIATPPI